MGAISNWLYSLINDIIVLLPSVFVWLSLAVAAISSMYLFVAARRIYPGPRTELVSHEDAQRTADIIAIDAAIGSIAVLTLSWIPGYVPTLPWLCSTVIVTAALVQVWYRSRSSVETRLHWSKQPGSLVKELRIYDQHGQEGQLITLLHQSLPNWSVKSALITAAEEVFALKRGVAIARATGLSAALANGFLLEVQRVADALWMMADRFVAAADQPIRPAEEQHLDNAVLDSPLSINSATTASRRTATQTRISPRMSSNEHPKRPLFCTSCGTAFYEPLNFCRVCGIRLRAKQTAQELTNPSGLPQRRYMTFAGDDVQTQRLQDRFHRESTNLWYLVHKMREIREGLVVALTSGNASVYTEAAREAVSELAAMAGT